MDQSIYASLISGIISGVISFLAIRKTFQAEITKIKYDYDKLLIQERLKYYPKLFEITQEIGKQNKSMEENIQLIRSSCKQLMNWRLEGGFILLSENSLEAFNELKESLKAHPGNGPQGGYTKEQLQKIWRQRNNLRGALKDDIGIKIDNYKD